MALPCDDPVPPFAELRALPNLLTLLRLFTIPFIVNEIYDGNWTAAFVLFFVAGLSDGLDGLLARRLRLGTRLGEYLDPIADKMMLSTLFLVLTGVGLIPRYVAVLVFSRDLGILLISTVLFVTNVLRDFRPSLFGKLNTCAQILTVVLVFAEELLRGTRAGAGLAATVGVLVRAIAVLAPLSAAQYAWIVVRRVHASAPAEVGRSLAEARDPLTGAVGSAVLTGSGPRRPAEADEE